MGWCTPWRNRSNLLPFRRWRSSRLRRQWSIGNSSNPLEGRFSRRAPLANDGRGAILNADNQALAEGPNALGIAMWTNGSKWIAAHSTGWLDSNGDTGNVQSRPTAVVSTGQEVATGSALGTHAMQINARTIDRIEPQDFAGYSMAAGDIDGDGNQEWIVGAPGLNRVEARDFDGTVKHLIVGTPGRFGAALAVGDVTGDQQSDLIVGAPAAGDSLEGKVYLYEGPDLDKITEWEGDEGWTSTWILGCRSRWSDFGRGPRFSGATRGGLEEFAFDLPIYLERRPNCQD